ncbi:hypothetical protein [Endozoicomonas sp.]|uniref:hypothetical protein n=1 Tax=Endozoicomonas sp. TaxID=1892382 RepID=UPI003AF52595
MTNRNKKMIRVLTIILSTISLSQVFAGPSPKAVEDFENSFKQCTKSNSIISSGPMGLSVEHQVLGRNSGGCQVEIQLSSPATPGERTIVRCIMNPKTPYTHQVSDLFNNDFEGCSQQ